jgi:hypothetical protein
MRKSVIGPQPGTDANLGAFLDLERLARAEITSEDPDHPIEAALVPGAGNGWRAATPGPQTIRIVFDEPQKVRRVRLAVEEPHVERTQQFTLSWVPAGDAGKRELVRQQFTFSPGGATREVEDFAFDLGAVKALELEIVPDIGGGTTRATLAAFQVG